MKRVGIKELQQQPSKIVSGVERSGRPTLVTRRGRPAAVLLPVDEDAFEDYILANAPEFVTSMRDADEEGRAGRTRPAREVIAEIEAEDPRKRS